MSKRASAIVYGADRSGSCPMNKKERKQMLSLDIGLEEKAIE